VLLADRCEQHGLELSALATATDVELRKLLPGFAALKTRSIFRRSSRRTRRIHQATRILLDDPNVDLAIVRSFPGWPPKSGRTG